jgi:hypothetical protein
MLKPTLSNELFAAMKLKIKIQPHLRLLGLGWRGWFFIGWSQNMVASRIHDVKGV